jgi:hypothetical protein
VVDNEIDGDERLHDRGVGSSFGRGIAHSGEIHNEWDTCEILKDDTGNGEGHFIASWVSGVPVGEVFDILFGDFSSVAVAEEGFENNADGNGKSGDFALIDHPRFLESGE